MFIIESYTLAVFFCVITMMCWGSWANTQKLAEGSWRFELFYWDYVLGILIMSIVFALTLGSFGSDGRSFADDLAQAGSQSLWATFIGGVVFNLANILLIAAIAIAGMSVAFPIGIGIALILGVIDNYRISPTGNAALIFSGVALIAAGIVTNAVAYKRLTAATQRLSAKGFVLSVIAGVLMSQFYGFVVSGMISNFTAPEPGKMTPYTSMVIFAAGIFASNFLFNTVLMKRPLQGEPISYAEYFRGTLRNHVTGILGGIIWCTGMSFSIIASDKAGPAISYGLGQGAVLVAAVWGVFIWREFDKAPKGTNALLYAMFFFFVAGLGLLIYAKGIEN
jgi:glucose uptake protein